MTPLRGIGSWSEPGICSDPKSSSISQQGVKLMLSGMRLISSGLPQQAEINRELFRDGQGADFRSPDRGFTQIVGVT